MLNKWHITFVAALFSFGAFAFTPEPPLADAKQEATAQSLFHALRCMVCEGQSLAESDATLARQMRSEIRSMVKSGDSKSDVIAFFHTRYGDEILMAPPLAPHTFLLWGAPLLLLVIGAIVLWRRKA